MVGRGWKIALLLNSSKICRALLALLPSSYSILSAGQRCESLVTSAVSKKKKMETAGERQNHSADASVHLGVVGDLGG